MQDGLSGAGAVGRPNLLVAWELGYCGYRHFKTILYLEKYNSTNVRFCGILFSLSGVPMVRTLFLTVLVATCSTIRAEEILLEACDRLPVVEVRISGMKFMFLVDTAAVSTLNLKSFPHGDPMKANVSSWSGTVETNAQDVIVGDLAVRQHHFKSLRLMAAHLSAPRPARGPRLHGILGGDLP